MLFVGKENNEQIVILYPHSSILSLIKLVGYRLMKYIITSNNLQKIYIIFTFFKYIYNI